MDVWWIYTFISPAISSNIHRYFNNTFHEFKVLKKVTITETFNVDFHNKFIRFWIIWFFSFFSYIYIYIERERERGELTDKMKRSFFQAAVVSILLYGCTTWTLTKRLEKKIDGNYTRMLRAILNKSWRQHFTRHQLYGHLPPITKTIQVRRARHAGHC